jgi:hypothetical protein
MGVYATRSPHRFNPIGLSIAKIEKIEDRTLHVSGIDLIHGTPIIDIKPYHYLDSIPPAPGMFPNWLLDSKERGRVEVKFSESSSQELQTLVSEKKLDFYSDFDSISESIS